jgi:uncharacterized protein (DUF2141 family)
MWSIPSERNYQGKEKLRIENYELGVKKLFKITMAYVLFLLLSSFSIQEQECCSLTIDVSKLRNSNGTVQFTLYNREDAFPDEHFKKYFKKLTGKIVNGTSTVTFENLPVGKYAVNILHDEDNDGKIKKGIILPKEGIGFSNYQSIGISNKPKFTKAAFNLAGNENIIVNILYL